MLCGQALLAAPGEGDRLGRCCRAGAPSPTATGKGSKTPGERPPTVEATETGMGGSSTGRPASSPTGTTSMSSLSWPMCRRAVTGRGRPFSRCRVRHRASPPSRCRRSGKTGAATSGSRGGGRCRRRSSARWVGRCSGSRGFSTSAGSCSRRKWSARPRPHCPCDRTGPHTWCQFNAPIGSLQAVQHRLADAYIDVVTAQDSVYDAAGVIDRGEERAGGGRGGEGLLRRRLPSGDRGRPSDMRG